jgi:hypothetical protein
MATYYTPKTTTKGLICCLDAANPKSYVGSGTAWNDLTGTGYNFTLTNNPTYGVHRGVPCFTFDGASDYAVRSGGISHDIGSACTLQFVIASINNTNFGGCSRLMSINSGNSTSDDYTTYFCLASCDETKYGLWYKNSPSGLYGTSAIKSANDDYKVFTVKWTAGSNAYMFMNGVQENSSACTTAFTYTNVQRMCLGYNSCLCQENSYIRIASFMMYNRELTTSEVLDNYNAIKRRFSL